MDVFNPGRRAELVGNGPELGQLGTLDGIIHGDHHLVGGRIHGEATVGDLMNPDVVSLYDEDPAMAAVNEMAKRHIHRIIVLDADSKLAGIVAVLLWIYTSVAVTLLAAELAAVLNGNREDMVPAALS